MSDISKIIKTYLQDLNMSIAELSRLSKLPQSTVDNIIYGRSKKKEAIQKIAKVLQVPVEYLLPQKIDEKFNHSLYHKLFNLVYSVLQKENIEITRDVLNDLTFDLYIFASKEPSYNEQAYEAYIKGIIFSLKKKV